MIWFLPSIIVGGIGIIIATSVITIPKLKALIKKSAPKTCCRLVIKVISGGISGGLKNGNCNRIPKGTLEAIEYDKNGHRIGITVVKGKLSKEITTLKKGDILYV